MRRKQEAAERKEAEVVLTQGRASFQEHDDDCNHYYSGTTCVVIRIPFDAAWSTEACKI